MSNIGILAQVLLESEKVNALSVQDQLLIYKSFTEVVAEREQDNV